MTAVREQISTIYVVQGCCGEYEEQEHWFVAAYQTRRQANNACWRTRRAELARVARKFKNGDHQNTLFDETPTALDPYNKRDMQSRARYTVHDVPMIITEENVQP